MACHVSSTQQSMRERSWWCRRFRSGSIAMPSLQEETEAKESPQAKDLTQDKTSKGAAA